MWDQTPVRLSPEIFINVLLAATQREHEADEKAHVTPIGVLDTLVKNSVCTRAEFLRILGICTGNAHHHALNQCIGTYFSDPAIDRRRESQEVNEDRRITERRRSSSAEYPMGRLLFLTKEGEVAAQRAKLELESMGITRYEYSALPLQLSAIMGIVARQKV